ncbi:hemicentin-1-like isoform X2 [Dysidea avara]|uniref:hemicentin-1-like isoform X2 n=1 Tax=Dysidea avara TaxID=196820 RepID=UPI003321B6DA
MKMCGLDFLLIAIAFSQMDAVSPNITKPEEGEEFSITEGSDRSITCTATGYPPPTVVWLNSDGSSLSDSILVSGSEVMSSTCVGNVTSVSVELIVTGATRADTGLYRCSASNTVGNNTDVTVTITIQSSLTFIQQVMDQTQNEGNVAAVFACQTTGEPFPTINWYFNDVPVDMTNTVKYNVLSVYPGQSLLRISNVQSSDVGTYTCNATNVVSSETSSGVLTVNVSPNITKPEEGEEFSITEGSNRSITCTATGYPPPTVVWLNGDGSSLSDSRLVSGSEVMSSTGVGNVTSVSVELIVTGATKADTGLYRCSVSNTVGNDTDVTVTITIQSNLTFIQQVMDQTQNEGNVAAVFACQATGEPFPTINWYFNDVPVDMTNTVKYNVLSVYPGQSLLRISNVQSSDVGTYTCNATNVVSSETSSGVLTVNVSPTITKPEEGEEFSITEGSDRSITCTATGYPPPTVIWLNSDGSSLNDSRLVSGSEVMSSTGVGNVTSVSVELIVTGATRADTGLYMCSASNTIGNDTDVTVNITIQSNLTFIQQVMDQTQNEGNVAAVFACQATGEPFPTISWYFNDVPVDMTNTVKYNVLSVYPGQSILRISNVQSSDVGTYTCNATNVVSSEISSGVLTVNVSPNITKPEEGEEFSITEGSDRSITCTATGYPPPTVIWLNSDGSSLNDSRLVSGSEVMSSTGVGNVTSVSVELIVTGATRADTGLYRCSASNTVGNDTDVTVTITIQSSLPVILNNPKSARVDAFEPVTFKCSAEGYGYITITWQKTGYVLPWTATINTTKSNNMITSILRITKTVGYYSGQYYCVVKTEAGVVVSHYAHLHVQVPNQELVEFPKNITVLPGRTAISNTQTSYEGEYCCVVQSEGGNSTKCAWLNVNVLPKFSKQPVSVKIRAGDVNKVAMSCEAAGGNLLYYYWEKYQSSDDSWIRPSHRAVNITSPKLIFSVIKEGDEGIYHCVVTNEDGSVISDNATITIYGVCPPSPKAPDNGEKSVVLENGNEKYVFFKCHDDYNLKGSYLIECKMGNWNYPPPVCVKSQ